MAVLARVLLCGCVLALLAGCAQTTVTEREVYSGPPLAKPSRVIVHNFAASPADIPADSTRVGQYEAPSTPPTAQEIEVGQKMGALVARELVQEIQKMGLPAVLAAGQPAPWVNDIVIMGYFESVDTGSAVKRVVLGFGAGAPSLNTVVDIYVMTDSGLRHLGAADVDSAGGKGPGVAVPLVVAAATDNPIGLLVGGAVKVGGEVSGESTIEGSAQRTTKKIGEQLKVAFQRQGWI